MFKNCPRKFKILAVVVLFGCLTAAGYLFYIQKTIPQQKSTIGMSEYFEIIQKNVLTHLELEQELKDDGDSQRILALAKEKGYQEIGKTTKIVNSRGITTTTTPLNSETGEVVYFTRKSGFGANKATLTKINAAKNTLTTFDDGQSGVETDLTTGEVKNSWGPLTHHSDTYDYDVDLAVKNYYIWNMGLGLAGPLDLFKVACGSFSPDKVLRQVLIWMLRPEKLFKSQITCIIYLNTLKDKAQQLVESGEISRYLPDLEFGGNPSRPQETVTYASGQIAAYVTNRGSGYSDPAEVSLFKKIGEGEWTFVESKPIPTLRPKNSNNSYPHDESTTIYFEYTAGTSEIAAVKIDPADMISEREENNNQYILGRDILNQRPTAAIDIIYPNPATAGELVAFGGSSIDVDGYIALRGYQWDFGNGVTWRTEDIMHYAYANPGNYTIRLKVLDNDGAWSDWTEKELTVNPKLNRPEPEEGKIAVVSAFNATTYAHALTWDGEYLWTANDTKLIKLNSKNGTAVETFDLPFPVTVDRYYSYMDDIVLSMTWDGEYLWIAYEKGNKIYKLNTQGQIVDTVDSPAPKPTAITWDGTQFIIRTEKGVVNMDKQGNLMGVIEPPLDIGSLAWDGRYIWAATATHPATPISGSIYKLDHNFNVLESFKIPGRHNNYVRYTDYPFYPVDLAWDGKFLWVFGDRERILNESVPLEFREPAIIYKTDVTNYTPSFIDIPAIGPIANDGASWDGDGFLLPVTHGGGEDDRIDKINLNGELIYSVTDEDAIYPVRGVHKRFNGIDGDSENAWLLSDFQVHALDKTGRSVSQFKAPGSWPGSVAWDGEFVWTSARESDKRYDNHLYKFDANGNRLASFAKPPCTYSLTWINDALWCSDLYNRIFKLDVGNGNLEIDEIYAPATFSKDQKDVNRSGKGLSWDGQNLWSINKGRFYKLEHILIPPDDRNQTPYFTKDSVEEKYIPTPTPTPTPGITPPATWTTYKNDNYKYEFMYPSDWKYNEYEYDLTEVTSGALSETFFNHADDKSTLVEVWGLDLTSLLIARKYFPGGVKTLYKHDIGNKKNQREFINDALSQIDGVMHVYRVFVVRTGKYAYAIQSDLCIDEKTEECKTLLASFRFYD